MGIYHSHPAVGDTFSEMFSWGDVTNALIQSVDSFIGTGGGRVLMFSLAFANKDVGKVKLGAVTAGLLADLSGNVGYYADMGGLGVGTLGKFSWSGCE